MTLPELLREVAPYVYLSGSFGRGDWHSCSDIDFVINDRALRGRLLPLLKRHEVPWTSPVVGAITIPDEVFGTQVEFAFCFPRYRRGLVVLEGVELRT